MKIFKRRKNHSTQAFAVFVRQRLAPFFAAPAEFKRGIFQPVNFRFGYGRESGFERGEPIITLPVEGDGAERVAREFGERVMCDAFAAVEKKRNFVAAENARERLVIFFLSANSAWEKLG